MVGSQGAGVMEGLLLTDEAFSWGRGKGKDWDPVRGVGVKGISSRVPILRESNSSSGRRAMMPQGLMLFEG